MRARDLSGEHQDFAKVAFRHVCRHTRLPWVKFYYVKKVRIPFLNSRMGTHVARGSTVFWSEERIDGHFLGPMRAHIFSRTHSRGVNLTSGDF